MAARKKKDMTEFEQLGASVKRRLTRLEKASSNKLDIEKLEERLKTEGIVLKEDHKKVKSKDFTPKVTKAKEKKLIKIYNTFLENTKPKKTPHYLLGQLLSFQDSYMSMSEERLTPIVAQLGTQVMHRLKQLKKAGVIEASSSARFILDELAKYNVDDWTKRGAMSMSDIGIDSLDKKRHFYKVYKEFYDKKTSSVKGAKEFKKNVEYTVGIDKYTFNSVDEKKQYIANFWYMYHNANEEARGMIETMQGYLEGEFILKKGTKISVQELIGRGDYFYFSEEDLIASRELEAKENLTQPEREALATMRTTLKDLLLTFDSREEGFTSSQVPKVVKDAINLAIRLAYEERYK